MKFLKAVGLAAVVTFLGTDCVKRTYQELRLEAYAQTLLPKIMAEQERAFGINHSEEIPEVEISQLNSARASYDFCSLKIRVSPTIDREELERLLSHELGHHYLYSKDERLDCDSWENVFPRNFSYFSKKFKNHDGPEHNWEEYLQDWDIFRRENSERYGKWVFKSIISEGIAKYFASRKFFDLGFFFESEWPETYLAIKSPHHETHLIYEGGYHLIKPLMDEFGVQPVVDYVVTHEPELTGNLKKDVLTYQQQMGKELARQTP